MSITLHEKPVLERILKLNALEFFQTQVEVALSAADGDLNVAVEILMSQQVHKSGLFFIIFLHRS